MLRTVAALGTGGLVIEMTDGTSEANAQFRRNVGFYYDLSITSPFSSVDGGSKARHWLQVRRMVNAPRDEPIPGACPASGLCRYGPCARGSLTGPHHLIQRGMERPAQVRCCLLESLAADRGIEFIL